MRAFFEENKWLYVSEDDLESIRDRLRSEISKRKNPLFVSLGEDEPIDSMRAADGGQARPRRALPGRRVHQQGPGGEYVWIAALPPGGLFVENAGEALLNAANELIAADPPARYHPEMKVEPAGPIVTGIASRHAVERDIVSVTITCLIVVALSIGLYFRRWRAIPLTGVPAVMGSVMAFAVAELAFGYLNSSTAFLGSIIIGNGINYAIVLMSRYEEHRARGDDSARGAALRAGRHLARHAGRVDRGVGGLRVADGDQLPRLLSVRRDGRGGRDLLLAGDVLGAAGDADAARPARQRRATSGAPAPPLEFGPLAALPAAARRGGDAWSSRRSPSSAWSGCAHFLQDPFEYDFRKLNAKLGDDRRRRSSSTRTSTTCSAAGRRRPSCWPTRSTRSSR